MSIFKSMISNIIAKNMKRKLIGQTISDEDITEVLKQIRIALLDADVNFLVVKNFIKTVRDQVTNYVLQPHEKPDEVVLKVVKEELINILGKHDAELKLNHNAPTNIMFVGLQGSGKTTSIAKLAYYLKIKKNKNPLLVALDIYRPAAIDQLKQLANKINVPCFSLDTKNVGDIVEQALAFAKNNHHDCVLFDTAGRLQTNEQLMNELKEIKKLSKADEILLVVDALAGQDIVNVAREFHNYLHLTGFIITKLDSEARAGATLSIISLLNLPVKFIGTGENVEALNIFHPNRIADQILGLGDVLTLVEKVNDKIDKNLAKKSFTRMVAGDFDLEDFMQQMQQISKLGSLGGVIKLIPGLQGKISDDDISDIENKIKIWQVLLSSMTLKERRNPHLIKKQPNRKVRILKGSGRKSDELNKLLSQWAKAKDKMEELGKQLKTGKNPFTNMLSKEGQ